MDITQDGEFPQGVAGTVHGQLEAVVLSPICRFRWLGKLRKNVRPGRGIAWLTVIASFPAGYLTGWSSTYNTEIAFMYLTGWSSTYNTEIAFMYLIGWSSILVSMSFSLDTT